MKSVTKDFFVTDIVFNCIENNELTSEEDFNTEIENKWREYWENIGERNLYIAWYTYQNNSKNNIRLENIKSTNSNPYSEQNNQIFEFTKNQLSQWEEFYTSKYNQIYQEWVSSNYYYKNDNCSNLEESDSSGSESDEEDNSDISEVYYVEEDNSESLINLGLPLSFGCKKNQVIRHNSSDLNSFEEQEEFEQSEIMKVSLSNDTEGNNSSSLAQTSTSIKKKKNKKLKKVPDYILKDKSLLKYWRKRFDLFSKYENGIQLDKESWFSVTPEKIASHIANRLKNFDIIIDGFCGCGGNTIQFAKICNKVIAIDIDPDKIAMAKNNAKIYNVENKIEFIVGDFLVLSESLKGDCVFLSPPWGGPKYMKKETYDIEKHLKPTSASILINKSRLISNNIAIFLPRNSNFQQIISQAGTGNKVQIENNYFGNKIVALTAFYGDTINNVGADC